MKGGDARLRWLTLWPWEFLCGWAQAARRHTQWANPSRGGPGDHENTHTHTHTQPHMTASVDSIGGTETHARRDTRDVRHGQTARPPMTRHTHTHTHTHTHI